MTIFRHDRSVLQYRERVVRKGPIARDGRTYGRSWQTIHLHHGH